MLRPAKAALRCAVAAAAITDCAFEQHNRLIKPRRALVEGGHFDATLVFQRAGRVPARFEVRAMGAGGS